MKAILKWSNRSLRKQIIGLWIAFALATSYAAYAVIRYNIRIPNTVAIRRKGLKVYHDIDLTTEVDFKEWGHVNLTESAFTFVNNVVYVKNLDNKKCVWLTISMENMLPVEVSQFIEVTWDYDGTLISPEGVRQMQLQLLIDNSITGITDFTFDIIIDAEARKCPS